MNARRVFAGAAIVILTVGAAPGAEAPPGASSCTGCHAAGAGVDAMGPLAGLSGIADAMIAFRSGARPATIMDRIAKGFSDNEIRALADWYAAQKPAAPAHREGDGGG